MSGPIGAPRVRPGPRVRIAREPRLVRIALAGCGSVGGALVRLLASDAGREAAARPGLRFELASVLVRHPSAPRPDELRRDLLTTDLGAFLSASRDADVVVEAIGGLHPAQAIARAALEGGRRLVTANKALIAASGPALARLAAARRRDGARLDFEAAVGGGIPVVRTLRDGLGGVGVRCVSGILNGTTNYVLTRLEDGVPFADAVREAQALGFAEADPSRDLNGRDAADKVAVLAWIAFGADPALLTVHTRGVAHGADRLVAAARALGGALRLVGEARRTAGGVAASVLPTIVPPSSPFARVRGEENLVVIHSDTSGEVRLAGRGAGGGPTAAALFADLLRPASPIRSRGSALLSSDAHRRGESAGTDARLWAVALDAQDAETVRRALAGRRIGVEREVREEGTAAFVVWATLDAVEASVALAALRRGEWGLAQLVAGE